MFVSISVRGDLISGLQNLNLLNISPRALIAVNILVQFVYVQVLVLLNFSLQTSSKCPLCKTCESMLI